MHEQVSDRKVTANQSDAGPAWQETIAKGDGVDAAE
jgi:hypothetical protein